MPSLTQDKILDIIKKDAWMMGVLGNVATLNLPDWWIGAGFVRSKIWDHLHGYKTRTEIPDIDVIYFDKNNISEASDKKYENRLKKLDLKLKWSVKNQARMHQLHGHKPYKNSTEALSKWVETATCIGVSLNKHELKFTAPLGIEDLVTLTLRPNPLYKNNMEIFHKRVHDKSWFNKWPKLKIVV